MVMVMAVENKELEQVKQELLSALDKELERQREWIRISPEHRKSAEPKATVAEAVGRGIVCHLRL